MKTTLEQLFKTWSRRARMAAAVGGLLLSGCADDEVTTDQPEKGERITFTAIAPTGSMSKALWNAEPNETTGKLGFNWEKDTDTKIDLWPGGTTIISADMSVNADGASVTITADDIDKNTTLNAFFPSRKERFEFEEESGKYYPALRLPAELTQKGASTEHLRDYMYLQGTLTKEQLASDEIPPMQLQHLCAVLRFKVVNGTNDAVRVTKVEMLATEGNKGVSTLMSFADLETTNPSDITVNVQDAEDVQDAEHETMGHALAKGDSLSVYAHCFPMEVSDGQFQFRVTVTDADGNNTKVFLTKEKFSVEGITTSDYNDNKIFQAGYYYTFHLDISKTGAEERFRDMSTWLNGITASESVAGEGSERDPYLIASAEDLQWLIDNVSESEGTHYKLTTNLTIESTTNAAWTPIGTYSTPFKGTFDGDGHTISGEMVGSNNYFGFFGYINGATIKNLTVHANVVNKYQSTEMCHTGGIAGNVVGTSTLTNCTNTGAVTGGNIEEATNDYYTNTGGIAGYVASNSTLENCRNSGTVTGGSTPYKRDANCKASTGGIAGRAFGTLTSCTNTGAVKGETAHGSYYTGGIVGENTSASTLTNCTNSGKVTGGRTNSPYNAYACYTGGIVGYALGTLTNCDNNDAVTGGTGDNSRTYTGGIAGYVGDNYGATQGTLKECDNTGTVTGGDVINSYSATDNNDVSCHTGGIAGYVVHSSMENCTNSGAVTGKNTSHNDCDCYTGGIAGYYAYGTLTKCTNSNAVTGGGATKADSYTGGIAGYVATNTSTLTKCTNTSSGTVTGGTLGTCYTGGLAGKNNSGTICTCCKDESQYSVEGTAKPIGDGNDQSQAEGCEHSEG